MAKACSLIAAVVFLGSALRADELANLRAEVRMWREMVMRPIEEVNREEGKPLGLKFQVERLLAERKQLQDELAKLKTGEAESATTLELRQRVQALEQEKADVLAANREMQKHYVAALEELNRLKAAVARPAVSGNPSDAPAAQVATLSESLTKSRQRAAQLEERQSQLVEMIESMRHQMTEAGITPDFKPPPSPLEGEVLAVKDESLLQISIGTAAGVKKGDLFDVTRPPKPEDFGVKTVGQAEVIFADKNKAACRLLAETKQLVPAVGDRVRARKR